MMMLGNGGILSGVLGLGLSIAGLAMAALFVGTVILAPYTIIVLLPIWWGWRRFWRYMHSSPEAELPSSMEWEEED